MRTEHLDFHSVAAILVVEDDDAVRATLCRGLELRGYHVLSARDGEDALTIADRHGAPIHLVISDVAMPVMNGLQLFDRLRGWYPTIRFLFISGFSRQRIASEDLSGPDAAFMQKPFTMDDLAIRVRELLDAPRARRTEPCLLPAAG